MSVVKQSWSYVVHSNMHNVKPGAITYLSLGESKKTCSECDPSKAVPLTLHTFKIIASARKYN